MILVVSDTHCYYDIVNKQIEHAENVLGHCISSVIHLGDFGIYKTNLHEYFRKQKCAFSRKLYVIDGNHEDFSILESIVAKYQSCFTYLPRCTTHAIDGYTFLALGGTAYMDAMITQRGAVITNAQIDKCLTIPPDQVQIILTHDCPVGIGVPNTQGLGFFGATGFPRSDELAAHFRPRLWLFGHHHKFFAHHDGTTGYYGLCGAWQGYGLLDADFRFTMIEHEVPWPPVPLMERILMKLRLIRPDSPQY